MLNRRCALVFALFLVGCPGSEEEVPIAGGDAEVPLDVVGDSGGTVSHDGGTDSGPAAECTVDGDCVGFFADLTQCELATCAAGKCQRNLQAEGAVCDDGDACTLGDRCAQDPSGLLTCLPVTDTCDDGDVCNGEESCGESGCVSGQPLSCVDEDQCNGTETCDPTEGCRPGKLVECTQDADLCNGAEVCDPSLGCVSSGAPDCDDNTECTKDSCDGAAGCVHEVDPGALGCCTQDSDCADDNQCTTATCNTATGACEVSDVVGACATGDPCALAGQCQSGECVAQTAPGCTVLCTISGAKDDAVECAVGLARLGDASPDATHLTFTIGYPAGSATLEGLVNPFCGGGECVTIEIPAASDSLVPSGHSVYFDPPTPADWGGTVQAEIVHPTDPSTTLTDAWYDGDVLVGDPTMVRVRLVLTDDLAGAPVVLHSLSASAPGATLAAALVGEVIVTTDDPCGDSVCFDAKPCSADICAGGSCTFDIAAGEVCDDGNPCTIGDTCDSGGECAPSGFAAEGAACTGKNLCTQVGTCDAEGGCVYLPGVVDCTSEAGACTTAACDPSTGGCVTSATPGVVCDDANACTTADVCWTDGSCAGTPLLCDDGVGCTVDGCDPASGCTKTADDTPCLDENPCTADTCQVDTGCAHDPVAGSCDDGDPCTLSDACGGGLCQGGTLDPTCGCSVDADCAPLDDDNKCNGSMACVAGECALDPATVVTCPADNFQCQEAWTCEPSTGECSGTPLSCDDANDCTTEGCSITDGCQYEDVVDCPTDWICELSGAEGAIVKCAINLARGSLSAPVPSGTNFKLHWDETRAALENFEDEFCVGAACFPFDLVTACAPDGTGCKVGKLSPSGHSLVLVLKDIAGWLGGVNVLLYHPGNPGKGITDAYLEAGQIQGQTTFMVARFQLTTAVSSADPVQVGVSSVDFNPASGLPLKVSVQQLGDVRTFVTKAP